MAGSAFSPIDVIDLSRVVGGAASSQATSGVDLAPASPISLAPDKQTRELQLMLTQLTSELAGIAKQLAPKDDPLTPMIMQMLGKRRSGPGPTPAPALPPTSTLTR